MGEALSTSNITAPCVERARRNSGQELCVERARRRVNNGRPAGAVIIFDWDDTLLCTTAMNFNQCAPGQLQQLETVIEAVVSVALELGDVFIVTNGNGTWVQDSSKIFVPKLIPLLQRLRRVMSARAEYEESFPGDPFAWKRAAFEEILSARQSESPFSSGSFNLIALGDNQAEIDAAQIVTATLRGSSIVKTVKFKEQPSVDELLGQLRLVQQMLPELVNAEYSESKALVPRPLPSHLAYLTSWASGWEATDQRPGVPVDTSSRVPLVCSPGDGVGFGTYVDMGYGVK